MVFLLTVFLTPSSVHFVKMVDGTDKPKVVKTPYSKLVMDAVFALKEIESQLEDPTLKCESYSISKTVAS